jgi:hypothetical protein
MSSGTGYVGKWEGLEGKKGGERTEEEEMGRVVAEVRGSRLEGRVALKLSNRGAAV